MSGNGKFKDGDWYRVRIEPGGKWDVSRGENKTVFFEATMRVLGGPMEGEVAPWQVYINEKQNLKDQAIRRFRILEFDPVSMDLALLESAESPITGKECWAQMQVQFKDANNPSKGIYPPKFSDVMALADRIPGGPAHKAAVLLGNTATAKPNPEGYADNF